jgi:hypothetical protein
MGISYVDRAKALKDSIVVPWDYLYRGWSPGGTFSGVGLLGGGSVARGGPPGGPHSGLRSI